jgi:hypothetical protein
MACLEWMKTLSTWERYLHLFTRTFNPNLKRCMIPHPSIVTKEAINPLNETTATNHGLAHKWNEWLCTSLSTLMHRLCAPPNNTLYGQRQLIRQTHRFEPSGRYVTGKIRCIWLWMTLHNFIASAQQVTTLISPSQFNILQIPAMNWSILNSNLPLVMTVEDSCLFDAHGQRHRTEQNWIEQQLHRQG